MTDSNPDADDFSDIDIDSILNQAMEMREQGDFEGAIALIRGVIDLSPASAYSALILGQMLAEYGDLPAAGRWLKHALDNNPHDLHTRTAYGTWLSQSGSTDAGLAMLLGVGQEVTERLSSEDIAKSREELDAVIGIGNTAMANIARTYLERGDVEMARAIAADQLADADNWEWAHDLFTDIMEIDMEQNPDLDLVEVTLAGLEKGQVSPFMILHALEYGLEGDPVDFRFLESVVASADALFDFDWRAVDPLVAETLGTARMLAGRAIMRGLVAADEIPALLQGA